MDADLDDPRVHVYGAPERDIRGDTDARLCSDADEGETVVFHVGSVPVGEDWHCAACGESSAGEAN